MKQFILNIVKIVVAVLMGFVYLFIGGMSVMSTDSCNANSCVVLEIVLMIGYVWLLISFAIGIIYPLYSGKEATHKWVVVFRPYIALPIFIVLVAIGMSI